jgi:hypothetical protein
MSKRKLITLRPDVINSIDEPTSKDFLKISKRRMNGKNMPNNSEKLPTRLLTGKDVAHLLRISTSKVDILLRCGELPTLHSYWSIMVKHV